jgi:hypothetical protein
MTKLVLGFTFFTALAANAMAGEWSGYIEDSNCAKNMGAFRIASAGHADCAKKCIKTGNKVVFITNDGKIYQISNPDKVIERAGLKVTIAGDMDGDTIKITAVK